MHSEYKNKVVHSHMHTLAENEKEIPKNDTQRVIESLEENRSDISLEEC